MKNQPKKTVLNILLAATLLTGIMVNLNLSAKETSDEGTLTVETMNAFADSGTCCPESGSSCVIGTILTTNAYYKSSGSCKE